MFLMTTLGREKWYEILQGKLGLAIDTAIVMDNSPTDNADGLYHSNRIPPLIMYCPNWISVHMTPF